MEDPNASFYANCSKCEWDRFAPTEWGAQIISVLHVLVKHPDVYYETTGKHPEDSLKAYAEHIRAFRSML